MIKKIQIFIVNPYAFRKNRLSFHQATLKLLRDTSILYIYIYNMYVGRYNCCRMLRADKRKCATKTVFPNYKIPVWKLLFLLYQKAQKIYVTKIFFI